MIQRYRRRLSFQKIPTAIYFAAISWLQLSLTVFSTAASGLRNTNEMSMHTCGFWQGPYAALDKAIKAGQRYPRFTVVEYTATGISDIQSCIITAFMFSVLTDRAFVLKGNDPRFKLEDGYDMPHIHWTHQVNEENRTIYRVEGFGSGGMEPSSPEISIFRDGDLRTIGEDADIVHFAPCNYGTVIRLTDNRHHKADLAHMGLRPDTIFGCAFDFLFSPSVDALSLFKRELDRVRHRSALKIAIQIRTNDTNMAQNGLTADETEFDADAVLKPFHNFFVCAREIQEDRQYEGQDVLWLVVSDNEKVRWAAAQKYPSLVLTNTRKGLVQHVSAAIGQNPKAGTRMALLAAIGEKHLLSYADYFVITRNSGYGRHAAIYGRKWKNIYVLTVDNTHRNCHLEADSYEEVSKLLPGVKH